MLPYRTLINIDRKSSVSLYIQLCNAFISLIGKGILNANDVLPSSRILAGMLSVNRNTVKLAFDELISQGWAFSIDRKGIYVLSTIPTVIDIVKIGSNKQTINNSAFSWNEDLIPFMPKPNFKSVNLIIDEGFPDVRLAPVDILMREYRRLSKKNVGKSFLKYGDPKGSERLRNALKNYLRNTRGLNTSAENILITRGSQMGIYLVAQLLLNSSDNIAVGHTNYLAADATFKFAGANLIRIPVDENGMDIDYLEQVLKNKSIKAVYVIPHHHCPTGVTLSMVRRMKLLNLAKEYRFAIIEDDYDFDFHYSNRPFLPLASVDQNGSVLYLGSLCKTFVPSIRIGFLVGPTEFIEKVSALRRIIDRQGDSLLEEAIAEMFMDGEMDRHFRKSLKIYHERRDLFCNILKTDFNGIVDFKAPEGGLAIWSHFDENIDLVELSKKALNKGLYISDGSYFKNEVFDENYILMGFASLNENEIYKGLEVLKSLT